MDRLEEIKDEWGCDLDNETDPAFRAVAWLIEEVDQCRHIITGMTDELAGVRGDLMKERADAFVKDQEIDRLRKIEDAALVWSDPRMTGKRAAENLEDVIDANPRPETCDE